MSRIYLNLKSGEVGPARVLGGRWRVLYFIDCISTVISLLLLFSSIPHTTHEETHKSSVTKYSRISSSHFHKGEIFIKSEKVKKTGERKWWWQRTRRVGRRGWKRTRREWRSSISTSFPRLSTLLSLLQ